MVSALSHWQPAASSVQSSVSNWPAFKLPRLLSVSCGTVMERFTLAQSGLCGCLLPSFFYGLERNVTSWGLGCVSQWSVALSHGIYYLMGLGCVSEWSVALSHGTALWVWMVWMKCSIISCAFALPLSKCVFAPPLLYVPVTWGVLTGHQVLELNGSVLSAIRLGRDPGSCCFTQGTAWRTPPSSSRSWLSFTLFYARWGENTVQVSGLHALVCQNWWGEKYTEPVANFGHTQPLLRKDAQLCGTCVAGDADASYVSCLVRWNWLSLGLTLLLSKPLILWLWAIAEMTGCLWGCRCYCLSLSFYEQ